MKKMIITAQPLIDMRGVGGGSIFAPKLDL